MKFGACLPCYGASAIRRAIVEGARQAEALGCDSVWSTDHVLVPRAEAEPYGRLFEALTTLAYVAPLTHQVRLGTSVLVLPLRDPCLVAKQVATLDALAEGRILLGLGAGWLDDEFRFLNADFKRRGPRFDEAIRLMRTIWTEGIVNFTGKFYRVGDAVSEPKPQQSPGPPLWIGGDSPAALRRAARLGDAWHPVGTSPSRLRAGVQQIREQSGKRRILITLRILTTPGVAARSYRSARGQARQSLGGTPAEMARQLESYVDAGVEYLVCHFGDVSFATYSARMRAFALEVAPSFAKRGG